jgi:ribosomal protein S17
MGLLGLMALLVMTAYGLSSFASTDTKVEALKARIEGLTEQVSDLETDQLSVSPLVMAATTTPVSHTDSFDLTQGPSTPKISSMDAEVGDRIGVAIELHQKYSPAARIPCAEDGVFLVDTFGNTIELAFKEKKGARRLDDKLGIVTVFSYGITFYPAADGEYKVYVGDRVCYIREEGLSATVHWDIYRQ